jgi:DNA invertase Pin-like site-specific DNA recombinase
MKSGQNANGPDLAKALHLVEVAFAMLVIARVDRLSRNAAFLLTLRDRRVRFVAVDMPNADDLAVGIKVC